MITAICARKIIGPGTACRAAGERRQVRAAQGGGAAKAGRRERRPR